MHLQLQGFPARVTPGTLSRMRTWKSLCLTLLIAAAAWAPATASAAFDHVVSKGETLSSVAAADGLSISELATANGMSADSELVSGSTLVIPPQGAAGQTAAAAPAARTGAPASAPVASSASGSGGYVVQRGDTLSGIAARLGVSVDSLAAANGLDPSALLIAGTALHSTGGSPSSSAGEASEPASAASSASGGYVVRRGDTLSAIAARMGVSLDSLAASNGLDPTRLLIAGITLHVSGAPAGTEADPNVAPAGSGAEPTGDTVSSSEVGSIAATEGVSPSLAEAVGYQESGFNNNEVSSTGATGVMQIEPDTWNFIGATLAGSPPLSPDSATDNIRAGALLLHSLLDQTGGDAQMALAGYYQGLQSVREHGLYGDTQAYVNNVMALQSRFGG
jgi:LysM repeat protein